MSNASYCRFRNTAADHQDCTDAIEALIHGEDTDGELVQPLSASELTAARVLIESCTTLLSLIAEEADIEASDLLDFGGNCSRKVEALLARLNDAARVALEDERNLEQDDDDFDDDEDEDDEEDDDDDDVKWIGEHQL